MLVATGLAIGVITAFVATRAMSAMLFGVAPKDPLTFVSVPLVLILTAIAATWIPATVASRADPATALRSE